MEKSGQGMCATFVIHIQTKVNNRPSHNLVTLAAGSAVEQGCQMVYFQTKNPNLGKFWRGME
jgi:hypothetical protein